MNRAEDIPQATIGDVVLVTTSGGGDDWIPALVSKACDAASGDSNIEVTATYLVMEGYKHENDKWWKREDAQNIARDEGVGIWKQTPQHEMLQELLEVAPGLLELAGKKLSVADKPAPKAVKV